MENQNSTLANWKEPQLECHGPSDEEILKSFDTEEGEQFAKSSNEEDTCKCERKKKFNDFLNELYVGGSIDLNDTVAKIEFIKKRLGGQTNVSWMGMHRNTIEEKNEMTLRVLEHECLIVSGQMEYGVDYVLC